VGWFALTAAHSRLAPDDLLGDLRLTAHGIDGHQAAGDIQQLQQPGDGGDLVTLLIDDDLAQADVVGRGPGRDHVGWRTCIGLIEALPQRLAVFKAIKRPSSRVACSAGSRRLHRTHRRQLVAIDGKALRQSSDKADAKSAIHMVSAWATANHISLGQVVVDEKSNEITAHPQAAGGCWMSPAAW